MRILQLFTYMLLSTAVLFAADIPVQEAYALDGTVLYYYLGERVPPFSEAISLGKLQVRMAGTGETRQLYLRGVASNVTCLVSKLLVQKSGTGIREVVELDRSAAGRKVCAVMHAWYTHVIVARNREAFRTALATEMQTLSCKEILHAYLYAHQIGCVTGITSVLADLYVQRTRVPHIFEGHWQTVAAVQQHTVIEYAQRRPIIQRELAAAAATLPRTVSPKSGEAVIRVTQKTQKKGVVPSRPWRDYLAARPRHISWSEYLKYAFGFAASGGVTLGAMHHACTHYYIGDLRAKIALLFVFVGAASLYGVCRYIRREIKDSDLSGDAREAVLRSVLLATDLYLTTLISLAVLLYDPDGYQRLTTRGIRLASDQEMKVTYTASSPEDLCAQFMAVLNTSVDELVARYTPTSCGTVVVPARSLPGEAGGVGSALEQVVALFGQRSGATPVGMHEFFSFQAGTVNEQLADIRRCSLALVEQYRDLREALRNGWQQMVYAVDVLIPSLEEGRMPLVRY